MSKLNKLPASVEKAVSTAIAKLVIDIEGDAKDLAPVDKGDLRASITHKSRGLEGEVGTNLEYAPYVELGTYKMTPQPYLFPAYKKNIKNLSKYIKQEIRRVI
jgi:HK97 gp10 family phage protein